MKFSHRLAFIVVALSLFISGMFIGCGSTPTTQKTDVVNVIKPPTPPTTTAVTPTTMAASVVEKVQRGLVTSANIINDDATAIKSITTQPAVTTWANSILTQVAVIRSDADDLMKAKSMLDQALNALAVQKTYIDALTTSINSQTSAINTLTKQIAADEDQLAKSYKEVEDLKSKDHTLTNVLLSGLIVLSVVGAGISVYLGISNPANAKLGIGLGAASVVVGVLSVTIISQWTAIAWVGLGLALVVLGLIIWQIVNVIKGLHTQVAIANAATKEVVTAVQLSKLAVAAPNDVTFEKIFPQVSNIVQSQTTQDKVADIKAPVINSSTSSVSAVVT